MTRLDTESVGSVGTFGANACPSCMLLRRPREKCRYGIFTYIHYLTHTTYMARKKVAHVTCVIWTKKKVAHVKCVIWPTSPNYTLYIYVRPNYTLYIHEGKGPSYSLVAEETSTLSLPPSDSILLQSRMPPPLLIVAAALVVVPHYLTEE